MAHVNRKYGISVEALSPQAASAVTAAERTLARTLVFRDGVPVAAIVPMEDMRALEPADPGESGQDPLLALCGSCQNDFFVDALLGDFSQTGLFRKS